MPVTDAGRMVNIVPINISVQKHKSMTVKYRNDPQILDRRFYANSADSDQTELHCLLFILLFCLHFYGVRPICFNFGLNSGKLRGSEI